MARACVNILAVRASAVSTSRALYASHASHAYRALTGPFDTQAITSLCISLLALFLVIWVTIKLTDVSYNGNLGDVSFSCVLGTYTGVGSSSSFSGSSNCLMLQILSGLTIGVGLLISIIQCYTCNLCGLGGVLDGMFALAGAGAWGYAGGVLQSALDDSSVSGAVAEVDAVQTARSRRQTTSILTWVEFGLFCALLLMTLLKCCPGRHK